MGEVAGEVGLDSREMPEILRLPVASIEARKDAEDLRRALRSQDRVGSREGRDVEGRVPRPPLARIKADELELKIGRHGAAGGVQEGRDVVGGMSEDRVLEVDQPDTRDSLALRQPDQVGRMIV